MDFKQIEALSRVPLLSLSIGADNDLVRKGDPTSKCFIMMEGLACTSQTLADGRRQTTAMHVPGDIPDLMSLLLDVVDSDIRTIIAMRRDLVRFGRSTPHRPPRRRHSAVVLAPNAR